MPKLRPLSGKDLLRIFAGFGFRQFSQRGNQAGAELNLNHRMSLTEKYTREGHPTVDDLIADQRAVFPRDPKDLLGDFWPEEESIDDFLAALREWRGHAKTDPAA